MGEKRHLSLNSWLLLLLLLTALTWHWLLLCEAVNV